MRVFKLYLLPAILLILAAFAALSIRERGAAADRAPMVCETADYRILILGDSHAVAGLNPALILGSCSTAQVAEELEYSYYKLKAALEQSEALEQVILSLSYFNILAPVSSQAELMRRYHRLLDEDFYQLKQAHGEADGSVRYYGFMRHLPPALPLGMLNDLAELLTPPDYLGAYQRRQAEGIGDVRALHSAIARHYYQGGRIRDVSTLRQHYLERIVRLCQQHEVQLFVVNTPLHPEYLAAVPSLIKADYYQQIGKLADNFVYLDYSALDLPEDHYFDYDHLNHKGARFLCRKLAVELRRPPH